MYYGLELELAVDAPGLDEAMPPQLTAALATIIDRVVGLRIYNTPAPVSLMQTTQSAVRRAGSKAIDIFSDFFWS